MPIKWLDDEPKKSRIKWLDDEPSQESINQRVSTAHDAAANDPNLALGEDQYERGSILPIIKDKLTGQTSFGMPEILRAGIDAAKLPGEVYSGQTQMRDADGNLNPDVIRRSFDLAGIGATGNFVGAAKNTIKPAVQAAKQNVDEAAEFGIDLSRGQATGKFKDQVFEQDVLTGGRGQSAQAVMDAQRQQQIGQIERAASGIQDNVSSSRVGDAFEAGENTAKALQTRAQSLKDQSQSLYKSAEGASAEIDPNAITGLSKSLRETLDNVGAMEGTVVAQEYPTAARALNRVDTLMSKAPDGNVVGVGWQNVERVRQMLLKKGSGADESRVLSEMRNSFDDWIENSVHDSLVSGDPKFLDDLKNARGLYRQYKAITDNSSNIIKKMADGSANSEQIANWLYGASKVGGRSDSSNTLREIKSLIGKDNPAINDLKRGVTMRLFQDRQGEMKTAGKLASDILEFANNQGHELAKELYGEDQLGQLRRFAAVLKKTVPDPKATNPSKSGHTVTRQVWDSMMNLAPVLGLAANSFTGMIAGFGIKVGAGKAAASKAKRLANTPVQKQFSLPQRRDSSLQGLRGLLLSDDRQSAQQLVKSPAI